MPSPKYIWPQNEKLVYLRPPKEEYHGKLPNYYSEEWFPELFPLRDNWQAIRDEVLAYEKEYGNITGMGSYSPAAVSGVDWSTINLMSYMVLYHDNRKKFPILTSITDKIPSITTVTISVLSPDTEIKPHYGDTNGVIRVHLGLIVPDPYPVIGMKVGGEDTGWKEGELLLFTIVKQHSVWSKSKHKRYVLLLDFVPSVIGDRQTEICTKTLGSQTFIFLYKRFSVFKKLPESMVKFLCFLFTQLWRLFLPIQRKINLGIP